MNRVNFDSTSSASVYLLYQRKITTKLAQEFMWAEALEAHSKILNSSILN